LIVFTTSVIVFVERLPVAESLYCQYEPFVSVRYGAEVGAEGLDELPPLLGVVVVVRSIGEISF